MSTYLMIKVSPSKTNNHASEIICATYIRTRMLEWVCELPLERNLMEITKVSLIIAGIRGVKSSAKLKCSTLSVDMSLYKGSLGS